ncbi:MAG: FAD-binding oxidoreductase [Acidimicrobiia bacterium]
MSMPDRTAIDVDRLRKLANGAVITPNDPDYDEKRKLFYGGIDARPGAVVRVANATDVAAVLEFAVESGVDFTVRSGGHSVAGHSTTDGGIVIDVRDLGHITIDSASRTASVGSGATAREVSIAAGQHGLGVSFGDTGSVGVGGIALGGGVGFLLRKYGLTIDSVLAAQIVTADGRILDIDEETHPDLFWAIRGGGGNFGVVTRFKLALNPVDPFVGGILILPATPDAIEGFVSMSQSAPENLTTIANVMSAPPMPFLPADVVGETILMGLLAWAGDADEGTKSMDRFRALGEPLFDAVDVMPYSGMYPPEDEDYSPTATARTGFSDEITPSQVKTFMEAIDGSDAPMSAVQIRALGGAMARVPEQATAFAHRDRKFMVNVASFYESQEARPTRETWVQDLANVMMEGDPSGYIGFLEDEGIDRVRAAYPGGTWDRLREVKAKYDPENIFSHNQNIPPARTPA